MPRPPPGSRWTPPASLCLTGLAVAGLLAWAAGSARSAPLSALWRMIDRAQMSHPNALWHVVHDLCVTDEKASGDPAPCAQVDLAGGYAVLKDIQRPSQYLLLPTQRITGIESPALLAPASPNYWRAAWDARWRVAKAIGRPAARQDIGLAINSVPGRTQNQMHIHIDCVRPDVLRAIAPHEAKLGARWKTLPVRLYGHRYRARWIGGADLGANDPFKLLAQSDPRARAHMGDQTLVLIGAARAKDGPGFVLLNDHVDFAKGDSGAGEELLDHHCAVSRGG